MGTIIDDHAGRQQRCSYVEELEKLAALRNQGIISDEESEARKGQLLGL